MNIRGHKVLKKRKTTLPLNKPKYDGPTWNSAKKKIKLKFSRAGVFTCEVKYDCCDNRALGFAHSRRRKYIFTKEQMEEVVLACQRCHALLDAREHDETESIVKRLIRSRHIRIETIYDKHYDKEKWNP